MAVEMDVGKMFADLWERLGVQPSKKASSRIKAAQRLFTNAGYTGVLPEQAVLLLVALTDIVEDDAESPWARISQGQWVKKDTPNGGLRRGVFHGVSTASTHAGKYGIVFIEGDDTDVAYWHIDDIKLIEPPVMKVGNPLIGGGIAGSLEECPETEFKKVVDQSVFNAMGDVAKEPNEAIKVSSTLEVDRGDETDNEGRDEQGRVVNQWKVIHAGVQPGVEVSWEDPVTGEGRRGFLRRIEGDTLVVGASYRGTPNIRVDIDGVTYKEAADKPVSE